MNMVAVICLVLSDIATVAAQTSPPARSSSHVEEGALTDQKEEGFADASALTYETCMDASSGVTSEMLGCINDEIVIQDRRLNETWGRIQRGLGAPEMIALRDAQRAWIAFRDARCSAELALAGGGSLSSVVYADCVLAMTIERTVDLDRTLQATATDADAGPAFADP